MDEKEQATRNLNPHKAARAAMFIYHNEYADQRGGSMDFWDGLDAHQKSVCERCVSYIMQAPHNI